MYMVFTWGYRVCIKSAGPNTLPYSMQSYNNSIRIMSVLCTLTDGIGFLGSRAGRMVGGFLLSSSRSAFLYTESATACLSCLYGPNDGRP